MVETHHTKAMKNFRSDHQNLTVKDIEDQVVQLTILLTAITEADSCTRILKESQKDVGK